MEKNSDRVHMTGLFLECFPGDKCGRKLLEFTFDYKVMVVKKMDSTGKKGEECGARSGGHW